MNGMREVLPLRIVAAYFIDEDEQIGLVELDRITGDACRLVQKRFWVWLTAYILTLIATVPIPLSGIGLMLLGVPIGEIVTIIGVIALTLPAGVFAYWRIFQYGGMKARRPQKGVYANPNDPSVKNLERLFAELQLESEQRPFYKTKNGGRREIDETYFFGSLRAAHVAKHSPIRDMYFEPTGLWFSREIFMEVDITALLIKAKAKPNKAGPKKTYDYTDALISLIEHPTIRAMEDIRKRGNQTRISELLEHAFRLRRRSPPSHGELMRSARSIQDAIAKNRSSN